MTTSEPVALIPDELSNAARMLAEARSIVDFRNLRDFASSLRTWARARRLGVEAENEAAVFVLRAERGAGQELARMAASGERSGRGWPKGVPHDDDGRVPEGPGTWDKAVRLTDLGISGQQASEWQRLAMVDDGHFERMIAEALAPSSDGRVSRIAKRRFYPWPEYGHKASAPKNDPLTPLFLLRTYADQVIGSSLARLPSSDVSDIGKIGVRLVKAARAELDSRVGKS
jgi:hypothetical protein